MPSVIFNGVTIAESDVVEQVEGNYYFPPNAVNTSFLSDSANNTTTVCGWKGRAQYYDIDVNGERAADAAWYYPEPKNAAQKIAGYVAFYKGKVEIKD